MDIYRIADGSAVNARTVVAVAAEREAVPEKGQR